MSGKERDDEWLDEYLEGDSELSRLYRDGADEQPDARLDARILAEARRAVSTRRRVVHSPFARHWLVPASLAAVLVLSLGVVLLMPDPSLERDVALERTGKSEPASPPASVGAPSAADEALPRKHKAQTLQEPTAAERALESAPAEPSAAQNAGKEAVGGAPAAAEAERADLGASEPAPAAASAPGRRAEGAASAVAPSDAQVPPRDPHPMPSAAVRDDPQAWLRFIEALLEARNRDGAMSNLRAFRARYPDVQLPERLAPLATLLDAQRP
ncbi:MAG: hypothetical protein GTO67_14140 [Gammaproteobacteria bacterium]|nr:hypothetical protein [Gammaproteobacteria bacterium]NIM74919.1 hypothetical protein [Gammaproteobacteria bacterium]NIN39708.1 hypothetical protein [Gammaproteobacteria bacterium]NIO26836.1 hypothetical protein [Gammaproteobacteria bacterium]NIO67392.1 hypothetical protein [Gammaproteobacteria bacterium]